MLLLFKIEYIQACPRTNRRHIKNHLIQQYDTFPNTDGQTSGTQYREKSKDHNDLSATKPVGT